MPQVLNGIIKWVIFSSDERAVLLEAFSVRFPMPMESGALCEQDQPVGSSHQRRSLGPRTRCLLSIRDKLIKSLPQGPHSIIGLTARDCEVLRDLVIEGIMGYYDFLISLEDQMTSAGVEFVPEEDNRQRTRFSIFYKLNPPTH